MPGEAREIAEALLRIGGMGFRLEDPVTFKSGIVSPVYCDNRTFPFWPAEWKKVIEGFASLTAREGVAFDVIGGIEAAGIPHSAALGYAMGRPSVFIRKQAKEHGRKARIEGGDVAGERVLLIEDLVTTGGSSLSGVQALREAGATVTDCLAIISYGFTQANVAFGDAGVKLHTLTDFQTVLHVAADLGYLRDDQVEAIRGWFREPYDWKPR